MSDTVRQADSRFPPAEWVGAERKLREFAETLERQLALEEKLLLLAGPGAPAVLLGAPLAARHKRLRAAVDLLQCALARRDEQHLQLATERIQALLLAEHSSDWSGNCEASRLPGSQFQTH